MFEVELRNLVLSIVSPFDGVHWGVGPAGGGYPSINLHLITEPANQATMSGPNIQRRCIVQIDVWSKDQAESIELSNMIRLLDCYVAADDDALLRNIMMQSVRADEDTSEQDNVTYRRSFDFEVWFKLA